MLTDQNLLSIQSLMAAAIARLEGLGVDEARTKVELLLSSVTGLSRAHLYAQYNRIVSPSEVEKFTVLLDRCARHEPVQYILGTIGFMGLEFLVNEHVLIPRPETEMLVERVIELAPAFSQGCTILDIGTGSGNIAISIARFVSGSKITAIDVSAQALEIAKRNAQRLGAHAIDFQRCDVLIPFLPEMRCDIIVSNPPYISLDEFSRLEKQVVGFEPRVALTDGNDGLTFIKRILQDACLRLNSPGVLLVELAYNQGEKARQLARDLGYDSIALRKDFQGFDRMIEAHKK